MCRRLRTTLYGSHLHIIIQVTTNKIMQRGQLLTNSVRNEASVLAAVQRLPYSSSNIETNCLAWGGVLWPQVNCFKSRTFISITYSRPCDSKRWYNWCASRIHSLKHSSDFGTDSTFMHCTKMVPRDFTLERLAIYRLCKNIPRLTKVQYARLFPQKVPIAVQ